MKLETTTNAIVTLDDGTQETILCSQERANELSDGIYQAQQKGIDLYFNICEYVAEVRDSKAFYLLGFSSFKDFAQEYFESGETQAKNMCLIASSYGSKKQDGSYVIVDKENLKRFTATQLYYIRGLNAFDGNVVSTTSKYGIDSTTKTADLRALVKAEKQALKDKTMDKDSFISLADLKADIKANKAEIEDKVKEAEEKTKTAKQEAKEAKQEAKVAKQEAKEAKEVAKAGRDFRKEVLAIISDKNTTDKAKVKAITKLLQETK